MTIGVQASGKFKRKGMLIVILLSKLVCHAVCISHIISGNISFEPGCAIETKSGLEVSFYPCRSQISKQTFSSHPILQKQFRELLMLDQQTDEFHVSR